MDKEKAEYWMGSDINDLFRDLREIEIKEMVMIIRCLTDEEVGKIVRSWLEVHNPGKR